MGFWSWSVVGAATNIGQGREKGHQQVTRARAVLSPLWWAKRDKSSLRSCLSFGGSSAVVPLPWGWQEAWVGLGAVGELVSQ